MDDASTDSTAVIAASYGKRVTSIRQPKNVGQFANVNDGVARVQGEYIAVFHADDVYHPTIVEREVEYLARNPDAGAVFTQYVFINDTGYDYGRLVIPEDVRSDGPLSYARIFNALLEYKNRFLCGPSSMVRATVYKEVGPYHGQEFGIASDLEMWVRISQRYLSESYRSVSCPIGMVTATPRNDIFICVRSLKGILPFSMAVWRMVHPSR